MEDRDKNRLRRNRLSLMDIEPSKIIDHLIAADVFDPDMAEEIISQTTQRDKMSKLLNMLEKRGHNAYGHFRRCLLDTNHKRLVKLLDDTPSNAADEVDAGPNGRQVRANPPNVQVLRGPDRHGAQTVTNNINGDNNFTVYGGNNVTVNNYSYNCWSTQNTQTPSSNQETTKNTNLCTQV